MQKKKKTAKEIAVLHILLGSTDAEIFRVCILRVL